MDRTVRAFELVALPYFPDVYRRARYATGSCELAEDLTQEVFLKAWQSFHRFEPGTNCRAWLMTILFYRCLALHRRAARDHTGGWRPEYDNIIASPPDRLQVYSMGRALVDALNALPAHYRIVLILAEVYEYTYREISAMMRIPLGTVMSRLSRSKKRLRDLLSDDRHDAPRNKFPRPSLTETQP